MRIANDGMRHIVRKFSWERRWWRWLDVLLIAACIGAERGFTSSIWEDVTVKISKGKGSYGRKISEADFRSWLEVTIDIEGPQSADIVKTCYGDLILDKEFAGRIYLKGLRVPAHVPER